MSIRLAATEEIIEAAKRGEASPNFRCPTVVGVVQRGRQLGRQLGFPTANISVPLDTGLRHGVYATRTRLADGRRFKGVTSLGTNPTTGTVAPVLEVWLFDFDGDLYGQILETELVHFLRPQVEFGNIEALVQQVRRDAAAAQIVLRTLDDATRAGLTLAGKAGALP